MPQGLVWSAHWNRPIRRLLAARRPAPCHASRPLPLRWGRGSRHTVRLDETARRLSIAAPGRPQSTRSGRSVPRRQLPQRLDSGRCRRRLPGMQRSGCGRKRRFVLLLPRAKVSSRFASGYIRERAQMRPDVQCVVPHDRMLTRGSTGRGCGCSVPWHEALSCPPAPRLSRTRI